MQPLDKLDHELVRFDGEAWTIRDSVQGTVCFGATGSGKTSGPLRSLALAFLEAGYGGVVLCCKPEEAKDWYEYACETYRNEDVIRLSELTFNFLDYERTRPGSGAGEVENIVNIFTEVVSVGKKKHDSAANEEYFRNAVAQLLRNAVTILIAADERITLTGIKSIIDSAPASPAAAAMKKGFCCELLQRIDENGHESPEMDLAKSFFLKEFPSHDPKTRSNVISSFTVVADALLRGELRRCFSPDGDSSFVPEDILKGKILLVDYNVKEWGKLGSYASAIIKFCFQKAVERRSSGMDNPVFIFADECQEFAIPYDRIFLSTARSAKVANVFATQNIGNLRAVYGKEDSTAILGNLQTKIICQNGDSETNEWAAKSIGKHIVKLHNSNTSKSKNWNPGRNGGGNASTSEGWREQKDFIVDPVEFTKLKTGSVKNKCQVEFVIWQPGRLFKNNQTHIKTSVRQECRLSCGAKSEYACVSSFSLPKLAKLPKFPWSPFFNAVFTAGAGFAGFYLAGEPKDLILFPLPLGYFITLSGALIFFFTFAIWNFYEMLWRLLFRRSTTRFFLGVAFDLFLLYSIYPAREIYLARLDCAPGTFYFLLWMAGGLLLKSLHIFEQTIRLKKD